MPSSGCLDKVSGEIDDRDVTTCSEHLVWKKLDQLEQETLRLQQIVDGSVSSRGTEYYRGAGGDWDGIGGSSLLPRTKLKDNSNSVTDMMSCSGDSKDGTKTPMSIAMDIICSASSSLDLGEIVNQAHSGSMSNKAFPSASQSDCDRVSSMTEDSGTACGVADRRVFSFSKSDKTSSPSSSLNGKTKDGFHRKNAQQQTTGSPVCNGGQSKVLLGGSGTFTPSSGSCSPGASALLKRGFPGAFIENSMDACLSGPYGGSSIDSASMISFNSTMEGCGEQSNITELNKKVEMVHSLISVLGSQQDRCSSAKVLDSLSQNKEIAAIMRQFGCLPMVVQLMSNGQESAWLSSPAHQDWETFELASRALRNIVAAGTDPVRVQRELFILKRVEIIQQYSIHLRFVRAGLQGLTYSLCEEEVCPALTVLMKSSFDEEQRLSTCQLGGLTAIADVLIGDHLVFAEADSVPQPSIFLRRYAGMTLTNLTFGDAHNKAVLCRTPLFLDTVNAQLRTEEELQQIFASVLRNLSWRAETQAKLRLRESGTVAALFDAAINHPEQSERTLKTILSALWNLAGHSTENKEDMCSVDGALDFLVSILTYESPSDSTVVIENGGGILRNLSSLIAVREDYRAILRKRNCLKILLSHLKSPSLPVVSNACGTLWNLSARNFEDQMTLWELGAVPMLKSLMNSKHKMISMGCQNALKNLLMARQEKVVGHSPSLSSQRQNGKVGSFPSHGYKERTSSPSSQQRPPKVKSRPGEHIVKMMEEVVDFVTLENGQIVKKSQGFSHDQSLLSENMSQFPSGSTSTPKFEAPQKSSSKKAPPEQTADVQNGQGAPVRDRPGSVPVCSKDEQLIADRLAVQRLHNSLLRKQKKAENSKQPRSEQTDNENGSGSCGEEVDAVRSFVNEEPDTASSKAVTQNNNYSMQHEHDDEVPRTFVRENQTPSEVSKWSSMSSLMRDVIEQADPTDSASSVDVGKTLLELSNKAKVQALKPQPLLPPMPPTRSMVPPPASTEPQTLTSGMIPVVSLAQQQHYVAENGLGTSVRATPNCGSRRSSLSSVSESDDLDVASVYSQQVTGCVSPSDLPHSPGATMPPTPKTERKTTQQDDEDVPRSFVDDEDELDSHAVPEEFEDLDSFIAQALPTQKNSSKFKGTTKCDTSGQFKVPLQPPPQKSHESVELKDDSEPPEDYVELNDFIYSAYPRRTKPPKCSMSKARSVDATPAQFQPQPPAHSLAQPFYWCQKNGAAVPVGITKPMKQDPAQSTSHVIKKSSSVSVDSQALLARTARIPNSTSTDTTTSGDTSNSMSASKTSGSSSDGIAFAREDPGSIMCLAAAAMAPAGTSSGRRSEDQPKSEPLTKGSVKKQERHSGPNTGSSQSLGVISTGKEVPDEEVLLESFITSAMPRQKGRGDKGQKSHSHSNSSSMEGEETRVKNRPGSGVVIGVEVAKPATPLSGSSQESSTPRHHKVHLRKNSDTRGILELSDMSLVMSGDLGASCSSSSGPKLCQSGASMALEEVEPPDELMAVSGSSAIIRSGPTCEKVKDASCLLKQTLIQRNLSHNSSEKGHTVSVQEAGGIKPGRRNDPCVSSRTSGSSGGLSEDNYSPVDEHFDISHADINLELVEDDANKVCLELDTKEALCQLFSSEELLIDCESLSFTSMASSNLSPVPSRKIPLTTQDSYTIVRAGEQSVTLDCSAQFPAGVYAPRSRKDSSSSEKTTSSSIKGKGRNTPISKQVSPSGSSGSVPKFAVRTTRTAELRARRTSGNSVASEPPQRTLSPVSLKDGGGRVSPGGPRSSGRLSRARAASGMGLAEEQPLSPRSSKRITARPKSPQKVLSVEKPSPPPKLWQHSNENSEKSGEKRKSAPPASGKRALGKNVSSKIAELWKSEQVGTTVTSSERDKSDVGKQVPPAKAKKSPQPPPPIPPKKVSTQQKKCNEAPSGPVKQEKSSVKKLSPKQIFGKVKKEKGPRTSLEGEDDSSSSSKRKLMVTAV